MVHEYHSDKICGPKKPVVEEIPQNVWKGINAVATKWWTQNTFMGQGNNEIFENLLSAEIPNLSWPISTFKQPDLLEILDLIEFCHKSVVTPTKEYYHLFEIYGYNPRSEKEIGQKAFRDEINLIFKRNAIIFQLDDNGSIIRLIPDEFVSCIQKTIFHTGDLSLDQLLDTSREKFLDSDPDIRKDSLEKLWDAWERLKTLESGDKKTSVTTLLKKTSSESNFFIRLNREAVELTEIGNQFRIRHHEMDKIPLESNEHVDYLFFRMFSMIYLILKSTNRIK